MPQTTSIQITSVDKLRLERLLGLTPADPDTAAALRERLEEATALGELVPPDVVTMNSQVVLRSGSVRESVTLVYPHMADEANGRVSVLTTRGLALLGHTVGDEIDWPSAEGGHRTRIESILFQPEASGESRL